MTQDRRCASPITACTARSSSAAVDRFRDAVDWTSLVARVRRNGELVKETRGGHPLGNLLFLLPWLARHAIERGVPLGDGDVVTAGTWTGVSEAFPGETIDVEFPAIGRASARFE